MTDYVTLVPCQFILALQTGKLTTGNLIKGNPMNDIMGELFHNKPAINDTLVDIVTPSEVIYELHEGSERILEYINKIEDLLIEHGPEARVTLASELLKIAFKPEVSYLNDIGLDMKDVPDIRDLVNFVYSWIVLAGNTDHLNTVCYH
jgi:hypothetical protein